MTNKQRAQANLIVKIGFKWKNTEHQIDEARHSLDAPAVPRPDLGTDVVNNLLSWRVPSQCASKTEIETWIIDQNNCCRFDLENFLEHLMKLLSEKAVLP